MAKFLATYSWKSVVTLEIEAENGEDALAVAKEASFKIDMKSGQYSPGSFRIAAVEEGELPGHSKRTRYGKRTT